MNAANFSPASLTTQLHRTKELQMTNNSRLNSQVLAYALRSWSRDRRSDERGEGVISTAIAVLIVAFLGAAMWVAFNSIWQGSEDNIRTNIEQIGANG